jgi:hypothetical protein
VQDLEGESEIIEAFDHAAVNDTAGRIGKKLLHSLERGITD